MPQKETKRKAPVRTAQFHVIDGPAVLFERVQFKLRQPRVLRFKDPDLQRKAAANGLIDQLVNFDPREWTLVSAVVREDNGKFIKSGWVRAVGKRTWFVLVGFEVIEELCDATIADMYSTYPDSHPLREKVEAANTELMNADVGNGSQTLHERWSGSQRVHTVSTSSGAQDAVTPAHSRTPAPEARMVTRLRSFELEVDRVNWELREAAGAPNGALDSLVNLLLFASDLFWTGKRLLAQVTERAGETTTPLSTRDHTRLTHVEEALKELQISWPETCDRAFSRMTKEQLPSSLREQYVTLFLAKRECLKVLNDPQTIRYLKRISRLLRESIEHERKKSNRSGTGQARKTKKAAKLAPFPTPLTWEDASQRIHGKATSGGGSRAWAKMRSTSSGGRPIVAASSRRFGK